jgi:flavin-dependent dehydrogenase
MGVNTSRPDFDVAVVGGGPAGSSMGAYLARAGLKCVVIERELFPRPHVGESLVPSSTRVFKDLDMIPLLEEAKFPHKYGAAWSASDSNARMYDHDWDGLEADTYVDINFDERQQPGVDRPYTYHVDRGAFDNLLLQHANRLGATVYEGTPVTSVEFPADDHARVNITIGRRSVPVTAHMIVDASGRRTLAGTQMKWKVKDPVFDQYALHTWFEGFDRNVLARAGSRKDFIFIHFLPLTNSWMWQIPITDTITSIGVVTQKKNFSSSRETREQFFWSCAQTRPELYEALKASRQMRPLKEEGDYSYAMSRITGDRLVLIGDAARFVDPIFSTGVSIALNCSRFAHKDIITACESGNFGASSFSNYETTLRRGTNNWYKFISVYYRLNVLFTAFIHDPRYRLDVLKLLQGDVYDEEEPPVLTRMRDMVSQVENSPSHPWHQLLGSLTANAFAPAGN